jgi:hypothetical protein
MHFTATPLVPLTSNTLQTNSINGSLPVEPGYFTTDLLVSLRTL